MAYPPSQEGGEVVPLRITLLARPVLPHKDPSSGHHHDVAFFFLAEWALVLISYVSERLQEGDPGQRGLRLEPQVRVFSLRRRRTSRPRTTREVSELTSESQGLERAVLAEREFWQEERKQLEERIEDLARQKNQDDADLDREKRNVMRLEAVFAELDAEVKAKQQNLMDLRRQIRESNDALGAAVSGNEHLRQQMRE